MDFELEWHQEQLREVADGFLAEHFSLEALRELEGSDLGYSRDLHRDMAELGWWDVSIGGEDGAALNPLDLVILYEAFGRAAVPGPHFASTVLGAPLLRGSHQEHRELIGPIAAGHHVVAVAIYEASAGYDAAAVELEARIDAGGVRLTGTKMFVPYALGADSLLVLARTGRDEHDLSWILVPGDAPNTSYTRLRAMSNEPLFQVDLEDVRLPPDAVVGEPGDAWNTFQAVLPLANLLQSAELVGLADSAFAMAVDYAKTRVAFGQPIGAFQAIQHKCADMLADRDAARFLVYQATCLVAANRSATAEVAMAKAFAGNASRRVCKEAHQIFGGHGFVMESKLNYFYRRQKVIELALGDVNAQLDLVAQRLSI